MKYQRHMTPPKKYNNFPVTDSKKMEIYKSPVKYFKIIVVRKLSELQENTDKELNKKRKTIHKQNVKFNRDRNHEKVPKRNLGAKECYELNEKCSH